MLKRIYPFVFFFVFSGQAFAQLSFKPGSSSMGDYAEFAPKCGFGLLNFPCSSFLRTQFNYNSIDPATGKTSTYNFDSGNKRFLDHPMPLLCVMELETNSMGITWRLGVGAAGNRLNGGWVYSGFGYDFYFSTHAPKKTALSPVMITPFIDVAFLSISDDLGDIDNTNRDVYLPTDTSYYHATFDNKHRTTDRLVVRYDQSTVFLVPSLSIRNNMHKHVFYYGINAGYWIPLGSKGRLDFLGNDKYDVGKTAFRRVSADGYTTWRDGMISNNPHAIGNGFSMMVYFGLSLQ